MMGSVYSLVFLNGVVNNPLIDCVAYPVLSLLVNVCEDVRCTSWSE
jgi:hypothetical protein